MTLLALLAGYALGIATAAASWVWSSNRRAVRIPEARVVSFQDSTYRKDYK